MQRHHHSKRQLFASWRLVCHHSSLLRMAEGRLRRRTLAATFLSWRHIAALKHRRRSLLTVSVEQQQMAHHNGWQEIVPVSTIQACSYVPSSGHPGLCCS
jgi:hypothetical protein